MICSAQIASTYVKTFDKVNEVMMVISDHLPHFKKYTEVFRTNTQIRHVLCLFYRDILDFHLTIVQFFDLKGKRF